ncbi:peptide deformylase [Alicyclobacillaceae bacterium I2511]|nr:peptide deformylase [Alicyclobacillaceae bacterium I2511]
MCVRVILQGECEKLRQPCAKVIEFEDQLEQLVTDLVDTLKDSPGLSLSAPQIGVLQQVFVMDVGQGVQVFINPVQTAAQEEQESTEWCASFPTQPLMRHRPLHVTLRAQDLQGMWYMVCTTGLATRMVCHELDHLQGKVFYDDLPDDALFQQMMPFLSDATEDTESMTDPLEKEEQQEFLDLARDALWKLTLWLEVLNAQSGKPATQPPMSEIRQLIEHLQEHIDATDA